MNEYYTYVLINSLTNEPIYIGKGKTDRCEQHFKLIKGNRHYNKHLQNKVMQIWESNGEVVIRKYYAESEQDALATEITWIKQSKTMGVKLCNLTDGGDGVTDSSGLIASKISNTKKGNTTAWNKGKVQKEIIEISCKQCGAKIKVTKNSEQVTKRKYCSLKCFNAFNKNNKDFKNSIKSGWVKRKIKNDISSPASL